MQINDVTWRTTVVKYDVTERAGRETFFIPYFFYGLYIIIILIIIIIIITSETGKQYYNY